MMKTDSQEGNSQYRPVFNPGCGLQFSYLLCYQKRKWIHQCNPIADTVTNYHCSDCGNRIEPESSAYRYQDNCKRYILFSHTQSGRSGSKSKHRKKEQEKWFVAIPINHFSQQGINGSCFTNYSQCSSDNQHKENDSLGIGQCAWHNCK